MVIGQGKTIAFFTLGCKLNFSESSSIGQRFEERGFTRVDFKQKADVYVINTCSVTSSADKKCRQAIVKASKKNPEAFIAVIGCYATLKPADITRLPGVDLVLGNNEKFKILDYIDDFEKNAKPTVRSCDYKDIKSFYPTYSLGDRTRSFLKVQDGCNYFCTYCTIPMARGASRNTTIAETIEKANEVASKNVNEVILTGVNVGDFGRSTGESFIELLKALDDTKVPRIRLSSIEPNLLNDEIIDFVSTSKSILPHFHIPLQSGSDSILKLMKRRYDTSLFRDRIQKIKTVLPHAFIGIDVIIGFPGETDELFEETYNFLQELDISFLHVFSYSERPGTKAASFPNKVHDKTKQERSKALHSLSSKKHADFYTKNIGRSSKVLFEGATTDGLIFGFTDNYIKVETQFDEKLVNQIIDFKITGIADSGNGIGEF